MRCAYMPAMCRAPSLLSACFGPATHQARKDHASSSGTCCHWTSCEQHLRCTKSARFWFVQRSPNQLAQPVTCLNMLLNCSQKSPEITVTTLTGTSTCCSLACKNQQKLPSQHSLTSTCCSFACRNLQKLPLWHSSGPQRAAHLRVTGVRPNHADTVTWFTSTRSGLAWKNNTRFDTVRHGTFKMWPTRFDMLGLADDFDTVRHSLHLL